MSCDSDSDCSPILLEGEEQEETSISTQPIRFSVWNTFKPHIPRFLLTMLVDVFLPFIVYLILQKRIKQVPALIAAGTPPLIMVIIKGIVSRTFDALGFLVFTAFAASAIAAIITHNAVIILLEKSLVTGLLSLIFGITLIPFHCCRHRFQIRPLAYYFYQDLVPTKRAHVGLPDILFEDNQSIELNETGLIPKLTHKQEVSQVYAWIYAHCSSFRLSCYLITSIWSVGLLLEFLARLFLILIHLSVEKIFIYGHVMLSLMTSILILLTVLCITNERKQTLKLIEKWKEQHLNNQQEHSDDINLNIVI
jgi:hypothetical protein